jgi:tRNA 2-thiouridine synthesizing protein A
MEMKAHGFVDITDESCPYTIVKTKVAIDDVEIDEILEIKMEGGVACRNIPKVMECDGHEILDKYDNPDGTVTMFVKRKI